MATTRFHPAFAHLLAIAVLVTVPAMVTANQVSDEVDEQLDKLGSNVSTNITDPEVYNSQRSGGWMGGRASVRVERMDPNLVDMRPPGVNAGCSGITIDGGAFSFIDSPEHLQQYFRKVASSAGSYAFKMAIEGMCSVCSKLMTEMQQIAQKLNGVLADSCQTGKLLAAQVPDPTKATQAREKGQILGWATGGETTLDRFQGLGLSGSSTTATTAIMDQYMNASEIEKWNANIAYEVFNSPAWDAPNGTIFNKVVENLKSGSGCGNLSAGNLNQDEVLMNMVGTVVVKTKEDQAGNKEKRDAEIYHPKLGPKDILKGFEHEQIMACNGSNCRDVVEVCASYEGLEAPIGILLQSIATKVSFGDEPLIDEEKAMLNVISAPMYRMLVDLSHASGVTETFAMTLTDIYAFQFTKKMWTNAQEAVAQGINAYDKKGSGKNDFKERFKKKSAEIRDKFANLHDTEIGMTKNQVFDYYNNVKSAIRNSSNPLNVRDEMRETAPGLLLNKGGGNSNPGGSGSP